jgi:hypothetical protein
MSNSSDELGFALHHSLTLNADIFCLHYFQSIEKDEIIVMRCLEQGKGERLAE